MARVTRKAANMSPGLPELFVTCDGHLAELHLAPETHSPNVHQRHTELPLTGMQLDGIMGHTRSTVDKGLCLSRQHGNIHDWRCQDGQEEAREAEEGKEGEVAEGHPVVVLIGITESAARSHRPGR